MLDNNVRAQFQRIAGELRQHLDTGTFSGKVKEALESEIETLLRRFAGQRVASNPVLDQAWDRSLKEIAQSPTWSGKVLPDGSLAGPLSKDEMLKLHKDTRKLLNDNIEGVVNDIETSFGPLQSTVRSLPNNVEVHHLLYKSVVPDLSVDARNLLIALSKTGRNSVDELHDVLHLLSSAGQNRFVVLTNEIADLLRRIYGM